MNRSLVRGAVALTATAVATSAVRRGRAVPGIDTRHLAGKTAVVTGAGSGIGRSLALLLAQRGALVQAADVDEASAETVAAEIRAAGGRAQAHAVDVADAGAVGRLADLVFAAGPVDLLFNNAGIGLAGELTDTTLSDWRRLIDVNLMGVVHGLHAFLPRLLAQGRPRTSSTPRRWPGSCRPPGSARTPRPRPPSSASPTRSTSSSGAPRSESPRYAPA